MAEITIYYEGPIVTREEASRQGLKYYFTRIKCKNNHIAQRYTSCISCVVCTSVKGKKWVTQNPEKMKFLQKRHRSTDNFRKKSRERDRLRYEKDGAYRTKKIKMRANYRERNPDKVRLSHKEWRERNPDYVSPSTKDGRQKLRQLAYRIIYRERHNQKQKEWRKKNPEKCRVNDRNKKLKRRKAEGTHTLVDIQYILKKQKYKCAYCKADLKKSYHVDHIKAIAVGGSNWPRNLQCLCPTCNMKKHTSDSIVFAQRHGKLL